MANDILTQERLQELFNYDPNTGDFTWKTISKKNRNLIAGIKDNGYLKININNKFHLSHRLAWLYVYGQTPDSFIDHIDGSRSNNRIANLRVATNAQNQWNSGLSKKNTSGFKGVHKHKQSKNWYAMCQINKINNYLGTFESPELASKAYLEFINKTHKNFVYKEFKI